MSSFRKMLLTGGSSGIYIPQNLIVGWDGADATLPDNWIGAATTTARLLRGSVSYEGTSGSDSIATATTTDGAHKGTYAASDADYSSLHGSGSGTEVANTNDFTSGPNHAHSVSGTTFTTGRTCMNLMKASIDLDFLPAGALGLAGSSITDFTYGPMVSGYNLGVKNGGVQTIAATYTKPTITNTGRMNSHDHSNSTNNYTNAQHQCYTNPAYAPNYDHIHSFTMGTLTPAEAYVYMLVLKATKDIRADAEGFIGIWPGNDASVPEGWVICDGNNGTPNLRREYVVRVTNSSSLAGNYGGSATLTIASSSTDTRSHNHSYTGVDDGVRYSEPAAHATQSHSHSIGGVASFIPSANKVNFIMYKGV